MYRPFGLSVFSLFTLTEKSFHQLCLCWEWCKIGLLVAAKSGNIVLDKKKSSRASCNPHRGATRVAALSQTQVAISAQISTQYHWQHQNTEFGTIHLFEQTSRSSDQGWTGHSNVLNSIIDKKQLVIWPATKAPWNDKSVVQYNRPSAPLGFSRQRKMTS